MRNLISLGMAAAILLSLGCAGSHPFGLGWDELSTLRPIPSLLPAKNAHLTQRAVRMWGMPRPGFQFSLRFILFVLTPIVALAASLYPAFNSLVLVWAGYLLLAALFIKALRTPS